MSHWDYLDFHEGFDRHDEYESATDFTSWTDKNGKTYKVKDMKTTHLINIKNMIEQNRFQRYWTILYGEDWIRVIDLQLRKRGLIWEKKI